jgi:hypothetical protein
VSKAAFGVFFSFSFEEDYEKILLVTCVVNLVLQRVMS